MSNQVAVGDVMTASNINDIERRKPTAARVNTRETRAVSTYGDPATAGPAVTVTTGTSALVIEVAQMASGAAANFAKMSVAVSGATTLAASDSNFAGHSAGAVDIVCTRAVLVTGLTAGSNTFTLKYANSDNATTVAFERREIIVIPQD